ncbi:MAG: methyltransferase [Acidobacteria bacterium]|nr:MAG: methyltransferase [Acidobacteriota bacterium]
MDGGMDLWFARAAVIVGSMTMVVIRAPYGARSRRIKVVKSRKGTLEIVLLTLAWVSFFVPLVWVVKPVMAFADYPLRPLPFLAGVSCLALRLWLFQRSHADLGANWSITLEVRDKHQLVTQGVYRHLRHPMYLALILYSVGQALVLPNWVAGPSYLVVFVLLVALRLGPEERMMREEFGQEYDAYVARTKRLLPGVW